MPRDYWNQPKFCDRCGNDFEQGAYGIHLPAQKEYVYLCHICIKGLAYEFYLSVKKQVEGTGEDG